MQTNLHNKIPGEPNRGQFLALTHLTNDEARTIYFALRQYEDTILSDIKRHFSEAGPPYSVTRHEDLMFLGDALSKVESVLWELLENHSPEDTLAILSWLNV